MRVRVSARTRFEACTIWLNIKGPLEISSPGIDQYINLRIDLSWNGQFYRYISLPYSSCTMVGQTLRGLLIDSPNSPTL